MELKKYTNKTGLESIKNPTPLRNDAGPLSGLQRNTLASLVHFVTHTTKRTRDASVYFFSSIPTRNEVFQKLFPLVSVLFWGVSKPTFKIQLVSLPNSISHCRRLVDR